MRIGVIIQARMGSTRLPEKAMKLISRKPMLWHIVQRLRGSKLIDEIIVATSTKKADRVIFDFIQSLSDSKSPGVETFIGSETNVLDRYYQAAKKYQSDVVVRVTSDCPLIDPEVVDKVIAFYLRDKNTVDYVSNSLKRSYPQGLDTEVFSFEVLKKTWQKAKELYQREHVTSYICEHPEIFCLANVESNENLSYMRWTVDEEKDLEFIREIYKKLYKEGRIFVMKDVLALLKKEPQLLDINKEVKQKKNSVKKIIYGGYLGEEHKNRRQIGG